MIQESRYQSIQDHIRRMHPEQYISKLPATEESFQIMINTPTNQGNRAENSTDTAALSNELNNLRTASPSGPNAPPTSRTSPGSLTPKVSRSSSSPPSHAGRGLEHSSSHTVMGPPKGKSRIVSRNYKLEKFWTCCQCADDGSVQQELSFLCVMGCGHRKCSECPTKLAKMLEGR